jgi:hypothetical protein
MHKEWLFFLAIFQKKTFSKPWKEISIVFLKMEKFFVRQKARKQRSKLFSNSASDAKTDVINVYVLDFMNQNSLVTLGQYLEDSNQIVLKHFSMNDVRIEVVANIGKVIRILLILSST